MLSPGWLGAGATGVSAESFVPPRPNAPPRRGRATAREIQLCRRMASSAKAYRRRKLLQNNDAGNPQGGPRHRAASTVGLALACSILQACSCLMSLLRTSRRVFHHGTSVQGVPASFGRLLYYVFMPDLSIVPVSPNCQTLQAQ